MAGPTFGASGTYLENFGTNAPAVAVPSGVSAGSVIVIVAYFDGATDPGITPPAGFSHAENSPVFIDPDGGAGQPQNHRLAVVWKRATGNDTGTYTFSLSSSIYVAAQAHRYEGCVTSGNPFDSPTNADGATTIPSTNSPSVSITTNGADRMVIHAASNWAGGTWTPPSGFTERTDSGVGSVTASDKAQAVAGSTGSLSAVCTGNDKTQAWVGALIPAASDPGPGPLPLRPPGRVAPSGSWSPFVGSTQLAVAVTGSASATFGGLTATASGTPTAPAGPTYGAAGARLSGANDTSADIAAPAGVVANSVVVVFIARGGATSITYETPTLPDGTWHLVPDNPGKTSDSSGGQLFDVAWHRATGSESGPYTFSWTTSAFRAGFAVRIDGCKTTGNPFEADDGAVGAGTTTPAVSVTTLGADRLLLFGGSSWSSGTWTAPSGYTTRVNDVSFDILYAATIDQAVAGSSGSVTASQANWAHGAWLGAFVADAAVVSYALPRMSPPGRIGPAGLWTPFLGDRAPAANIVTASATATFGGLAATASGTPTVVGSAAAAFGRLTATASGTPTVVGSATATLGGLSAVATGTPTVTGSATAPLGGLTGTASATVTPPAVPDPAPIYAPPPGRIAPGGRWRPFLGDTRVVPLGVGSAAATLGGLIAVATGTPTVTASASATLGRLTAAATATPTVTGSATASFGRLTAASTAAVAHPAQVLAALGRLTATATGTRATFAAAVAQLGGLHAVAVIPTAVVRGTMRATHRPSPAMRATHRAAPTIRRD